MVQVQTKERKLVEQTALQIRLHSVKPSAVVLVPSDWKTGGATLVNGWMVLP